ncbi:MAG TPA: amino acid ABC transporter permease [Streptosporangiaceae bacterium]
MNGATVLYDVPGPRGRRRNRLLGVVFALAFAAAAGWAVWALGQKDQWTAQKWQPFLQGDIWTVQILPGLVGTLKAAAIAAVLALAFGVVFGIARLSGHRWIRWPAGTVVEFFRAIPLLLLIFFASYAPGALTNFAWNPTALQAVVFGLTMYNGSVLAEVVRAGINAIPKGQSEAGYAVGLRQGQLMRLVLVPQTITAMMPAIVSQLVVLLKDTALGTIIAYDNLTSKVSILQNLYTNAIPAAIVIACVYIPINLALAWAATRLERRNRRRWSAAAPAAIAAEPETLPGAAPAAGRG